MSMPKPILCTVVAALLSVSLASAQSDPRGHWEGTFITADGQQVALALDLAQNAKGEWIASMGLPSQHATGLVVSDVVVNGPSVTFVGVELMMSRFNLTLGADGKLKGTMANPRSTMPIELTRTGEAKVELIAPSPAVSKELEGDWEGSLAMGDRTIPVVVHFKNQLDNTVAASADMGPGKIPLNDVKQAGSTVTFGVRVAHSTFEGKLNTEGTQLSGQWIHEQGSVPLTLVKK